MGANADFRAGIKERLETIEGLTVYETPPGVGTKYPHVVIEPPSELAPSTMTGVPIEAMSVLTIRAQAARGAEGWAQLEAMLDPTGETSIAAAIREDRTLGGRVDWARWAGTEERSERDLDNPLLYEGAIIIRWAYSGG